MTVTVRPFAEAGTEWDRFGAARPGWTAMHRWAWKAVMENALGHESLYWGAYQSDGSLSGILPLVRVKSALFGHYLVSLPFLNYGGPLGTVDAVAALARAATDRGRADGAKLVELRSRAPLAIDLPVSHRKITVCLELPESDDALMKRFPAKLRSQVRRPDKEGVEVRFGPDQVEPFYRVFRQHMHSLGTPVMPRRLFDALPDAFGEDVWFGVGYLGREPIACGAGFRWNQEFEMTWASSLSQYNRISANMGVYWAFMRRAMAAGLRTFNFGRCTPGSGTHRFKNQWTAVDEPLNWYQASANGAVSTPSPDSGPFSWAPRIWSRLPGPIANKAGPLLARLIP
ncbi:MAG: FemAB family XrtA/PEP-CTERM system-associated protein [Gemmatimonadales bacterium]